MRVSIVVEMQNSSADKHIMKELYKLMRSMSQNISIRFQEGPPPAPQQGHQEDRGPAPQQQGQPPAASLQRHPSHLSGQGSLQSHPSNQSLGETLPSRHSGQNVGEPAQEFANPLQRRLSGERLGEALQAQRPSQEFAAQPTAPPAPVVSAVGPTADLTQPTGAARAQGPQQGQPTPGTGGSGADAGSGRPPLNLNMAPYRPPAVRNTAVAGQSGSPETWRSAAPTAPQAPGSPAKRALPPPGFEQLQGRAVPQPDGPLRPALQPEADPRPVPQPELRAPPAPLSAPAPRPAPPPLAPVQQPAPRQQTPPVAVAAAVAEAPEKLLTPSAVKLAEVLRRANQSEEEATKELKVMMERQKFTQVAWEDLTAAAKLIMFDKELSKERTPVNAMVDALMSLQDRKPRDLEAVFKELLTKAWGLLSPAAPFTKWQQVYPAVAFIVSCLRYTGRGGMSMPDTAETIAVHLLPNPNTILAGMEVLAQLVTDEVTSKQFLTRTPAGCLTRIRDAVRKHVLNKPGNERYSNMLSMHMALTERGLQPAKVWPDPEAVKPNGYNDFPLSVIMIAWRPTGDGSGQQLMIGNDREEISLWNSHGLCEKRIKLEGHRPVHGAYSADGKMGVAVVDISYGHDPNSALVVFKTEPPYTHIGSQLMIKIPEIERCISLTTNNDKTLYIVGGNDGAKKGLVHSYIIDETSGVPNRQAGQMGRLASTTTICEGSLLPNRQAGQMGRLASNTTICEVGYTLHSVTMFRRPSKPVFIAGGGTPARLEMWELQGKKPAQRLVLPEAAADSDSFVSSVACTGYQVAASSGTTVYQWDVKVRGALGGEKHPVRVFQLDPSAPARHIAFCNRPSADRDRPFLGAAISTERLLYYVVFKDDGSKPECIEASINSYDDKDKMPLGTVAWAGPHPILYGGASNGSTLVFYLNP